MVGSNGTQIAIDKYSTSFKLVSRASVSKSMLGNKVTKKIKR